jgi:hypothetical protein
VSTLGLSRLPFSQQTYLRDKPQHRSHRRAYLPGHGQRPRRRTVPAGRSPPRAPARQRNTASPAPGVLPPKPEAEPTGSAPGPSGRRRASISTRCSCPGARTGSAMSRSALSTPQPQRSAGASCCAWFAPVMRSSTTTPMTLADWSAVTTGHTDVHLPPGDHFFLHSAEEELLRLMGEALAGRQTRPASPGSTRGRRSRTRNRR